MTLKEWCVSNKNAPRSTGKGKQIHIYLNCISSLFDIYNLCDYKVVSREGNMVKLKESY